jgi:hypothetical protein
MPVQEFANSAFFATIDTAIMGRKTFDIAQKMVAVVSEVQ